MDIFNLVKIQELPGCFVAVKERTGGWLYRQPRIVQATKDQLGVTGGKVQIEKVL